MTKPLTPCECATPGLCARHSCYKTTHWHALCRTRPEFFQMWEEKRGPCLEAPAPIEFCKFTPYGKQENTYHCDPRQGGCGRVHYSRRIHEVQFACPAKLNRAIDDQKRYAIGTARPCCGGKRTPALPKPSLFKRAVGFTKSMTDFAIDLLQHGEAAVLPEFNAAQRAAVCEACPNRDGDWCNGCGCYLPTARKIRSKHCPAALWPGDDVDWTPSVHEDWLKKLMVIVPHLNREWTEDCLADCQRESVLLSPMDGLLGWLGTCNLGLRHGIANTDCDFFVLLNDDVRLSENFFAGLLIAHMQTGSDMVTACYNVGWGPQLAQIEPNKPMPKAEDYKPRPTSRQLGTADGTCVMLTRRLLNECDLLDPKFGKYGWGAISDLAIRAKSAGYTISVTDAAYCYHLSMQTAMEVHGPDYPAAAQAETERVFLEKWGPDYKQLIEAI